MRVLELPAYFYPESMSSAHLDKSLRQTIVDAGIEIAVYCPTPTRGITPELRRKYKKKRAEKLFDGHLTVHRFSLYGEGQNPILRALRYTLSCIIQFCKAVFARDAKNCDVMFITSTPPIKGAMAGLAKKFNHKPIVYNLQDIFPDSLAGSGLAKKGGLLWKIGRVIENFTYRNADKIIVISEDFKKNIMAKGVPEEKIEVIYNWVDEKAVVPIKKEDNILYSELNLPEDKFYVVYAGNFGNAQNIDVIINAAEKLQNHEEICFALFGTGGMVDDYKKMVQKKNLGNVMFFPLQPYDKVSYVYSLGSVGIVSCKKGLGKGAMPSKTWSIMSAGTPVIANYDTDTDMQRIITENKLGVFSHADDAEDMAKAILEMYNSPTLCQEYGKNARQFIEQNLTKEVGTQKYVEVLKSFDKKIKN